MKELIDNFDQYVKVANEMEAIKDAEIKRLEEFIEYQETVLESRADFIEQLQMQIFVEQRKSHVINKKSADKLKAFVRDNYKTQKQFAKQLGVTQAHVSQWMTGKKVVPIKRAEQIEHLTRGAITRNELTATQ